MIRPQQGDTFQPGDLLNNTYEIEALLGRGGTSDVYRARSVISGRLVAIKVLQAELAKTESYLRLMTREEAIRDVRHDAVVRYSENQRTADGQVYLVMDFVEGIALDRRIAQGPMPAEAVMQLAARVLQGLVAAHAKSMVHRDLSPDNIILRNGKVDEAVIIDFGIAKDETPGADTIVGTEFAGKFAYAAPEQLGGRSDARSDLYALAVVLLSAFRGADPAVADNLVGLLQQKQQPLALDGIPEPLRGLIAKMGAPDPADRFQSADACLRAIDPTYTAPHVVKTEPALPPPITAKKPAARRLLAGAAALCLLLVALAGWLGWFTPAPPKIAPFVFAATRTEGAVQISGHVPDAATKAGIEARLGGEVALASGEIVPSWGPDVLRLLDLMAALPLWEMAITDNAADLSGTVANRAERDALETRLAAAAGGLTIRTSLLLAQNLLTPDSLAPVIAAQPYCGPLTLNPPTPEGWGPDDPVIVTGALDTETTRRQLLERVQALADGRDVRVDTEILNQNLCAIAKALPRPISAGIRVIYGYGDRAGINADGRYRLGENPVIDLVIPADMTSGYLWVSIVDVSGAVFHLLPNISRSENAVAALRNGLTGEARLRVAYPEAEATEPGKLAFRVEDTELGKSGIFILHAETPLFGGQRPMVETAAQFAAALAEAAQSAKALTLDRSILTTQE